MTGKMMFRTQKQEMGERSELIACQFLTSKGLTLIKRNFRCKCGEIDLIMRSNDIIVFVEVRNRKNSKFGSALESISISKQRKLIRAAQFYIQCFDPLMQQGYRFDAVAVEGVADENPAITWIESAFYGSGIY